MLGDFYGTIREGLKEKLGTVLFQLPPRTDYTEERLEKIIGSVDNSFVNVLEFRHDSWWNAEVYRKLAKAKITFCGMSHPDHPQDIIHNTSTLYYRLHGIPELYKSPYSLPKLKKIANEIEVTVNSILAKK